MKLFEAVASMFGVGAAAPRTAYSTRTRQSGARNTQSVFQRPYVPPRRCYGANANKAIMRRGFWGYLGPRRK